MSSSKPYDYQYKILVIGDSSVGKTSILTRYVDEKYFANYLATIGIDYKIKNIEIDDKKIRLQIWDTAGQERFRTITGAYFRKAMGIVLVYDITSTKSFDSINQWLDNIQKNAPEDTKVIIVGNKCDMDNERQINFQKAKQLAEKHDINILEVSAKDNININETFLMLTKMIKNKDQEKIDENAKNNAKNKKSTNNNSTSNSTSNSVMNGNTREDYDPNLNPFNSNYNDTTGNIKLSKDSKKEKKDSKTTCGCN